jgi:hypothetical protein
MRITQTTVERLAREVEGLTGFAPVQGINHPGDGRTHYVMAESMTSTYYGARQATAYLLGMLHGLDPAGKVRHIETRPQWVADIDNEYEFGNIPAKQLAARQAGTAYGEKLRGQQDHRAAGDNENRISAAAVAADAARRISQHKYVAGIGPVGTSGVGLAVFTVKLKNSQAFRFTIEAAD